MPTVSRPWDIVRVDFPYGDTTTIVSRPALVIATSPATQVFGILWVMMITSARHTPWPDDILISDLPKTGLSRPSIVRTAKIASIDNRIVATLGQMAEPDRIRVSECLKRQLAAALTF